MADDLEQFSALNQRLKSVVIHQGLMVDNNLKALVSALPPRSERLFCVMDPAPLKQYLQQRGRLAVVVERREKFKVEEKESGLSIVSHSPKSAGQPEWRWVSQIDGKVVVLEKALNYLPHEGACVAVLLGFDTGFWDEKSLEKQDKHESRYRWI